MAERKRSAAAAVGREKGAVFYYTTEPGARTVVQLGKDPRKSTPDLSYDPRLHRVSQRSQVGMGFRNWVNRFSFVEQ